MSKADKQKAAFIERLNNGCGKCDFDEAEGGLLNHCDECCAWITAQAYDLFVTKPEPKVTQHHLTVYDGAVAIAEIVAPEGAKLDAVSEPSGALRVTRWYFGDPFEIRQFHQLFAKGAWTSVIEEFKDG